MRMMITNLTMAIRRNRMVTITVTKRILMAVTMVTRRIRTATITVTRRIPTVKITMVINSPMEDTVKSNLMVIKATVMVMAINNTEAMDVNLTDTVTNLPMVTDTNLTDMDLAHLMADTDNLMVDTDNNPMVDMDNNLMVMVMDTNLNTVTTTTNNLTAILLTVIPTDTKAMEVMVMAMVINNTEAMVIDKLTEDTVTNLPTDMDTKVMEAMVTNNLMVDMVTSNLMVNTTATTTNLTEQRSDSNFISVIT